MSVRRLWIVAPGLWTVLAAGCGDNRRPPASDAGVDTGVGDLTPRSDGGGEGEAGEVARADGMAGDLAEAGSADAAGEGQGDGAGGEVGPSCSDGVLDGDEVDVDCGGACGRCAIGRACRAGGDCASGACNAGHICIECFTAANCPGQDAECSVRACVGSACVVGLLAAGTVLPTQTPGDCRSRRCDGFGQVALVTDDGDLPEDGNPCTREVCTSGVPSNPPAPAATACGSGRLCDGTGHCVGCLAAGDCPGTDDECKTRACEQNLCGFTFRASGARVATQVAGDCQVSRCDGSGHVVPASDDTDVPVDGNSCTEDVCASGVASNPNRPVGSACLGGNHCDSAGRCVSCLVATDCPGLDTACRRRTCVRGACGFDTLANGTPVVAQTPGDCKVVHCDGTGVAVTDPDNGDLPADGNACTADVCTAGVPTNPPLPGTTPCGGSKLCDGDGHCVGCLLPSDCPGEDSVCQTRTCDGSMVCGLDNVPDGTAAGTQTTGDCVTRVCNGAGALRPMINDSDLPDDGRPCTREVCAQGTPSHPPFDAETACPGGVCDGQGSCVACVSNADCGPVGPCATYTCSTGHTCSATFVGAGTAIPSQTIGDCQVVQCDGSGGQVTVTDGNDVVADSSSCTDDICDGQTPRHPFTAAGTGCGGSSVCDGAGHCGPAPVDAGVDGDGGGEVGGDDAADAGADAPTSSCPAPYVFCDDFEDGDAVGWTAVDQTPSTPAVWTVATDTGHAGGSTLDFQGSIPAAADGGAIETTFHYQVASVSAAGGPWTDQTVSVWIKPTVAAFGMDANKPGVCARFTSAGTNGTSSGYCVFIRSDGTGGHGKLQISKKTTSSISSPFTSSNANIAGAVIPVFAVDTWYKIGVKVSGSTTVTIRVLVNDIPVVEITDVGTAADGGVAAFTSGGPALSIRGANATYDDLRVSVP